MATTATTTKKRKSNNPLSDARKSQSFYETLWKKKSGLGFSLFVQYYGQQPSGVVVSFENNSKSSSRSNTVTSTSSTTKTVNQGMSRAAKRRRKKSGCSDTALTVASHAVEKPNPSANTTSGPNRSRLLAQLDRSPEYAHLEPFLTALSKPLPLTFRLRNLDHAPHFKPDQAALEKQLAEVTDLILPVSFNSTIYQARDASLHKSSLSRNSPQLKEILLRGSSQGLLARQELGSMLPIVGLHCGRHLRANHRVLDVCASPGSKTLQALEIVGPKGRVVANDIHPKRLDTLKEAVQRSGMEHLDRLVYTSHDASAYPIPKTIAPHIVVADVPCSGDGTIRKDQTVLPSWSPSTARALHELQVRILIRALQLVRVGGIVSYSTCSLNPIENEAVVQAALGKVNTSQGKSALPSSSSSSSLPPVELIEWPELEGLTLRPGIWDWKVLDCPSGITAEEKSVQDNDQVDDDVVTWVEYSTYEEALADKMPHCYPTLWPNKEAGISHLPLNLHRCRRLWPQDQDTGGFFVALLRKNVDFTMR
ncbi:methyltransferase [Fragilaria crotonensis]|nr:methyltransferase [Fragilaria crotonensis]